MASDDPCTALGDPCSTLGGAEPVARLVGRLFLLIDALRERYDEAATASGLTPAQVRLLLMVDQPVPQKELAEHFHCDASNITGLVDRLETRGLVERSVGEDRRVKQVSRTETGCATVEAFRQVLHTDVPGLRALDAEQLAQLDDLLATMIADLGDDPTSV